MKLITRFGIKALLFVVLSVISIPGFGQDKSSLEVYGFIMADAGYEFKASDPSWFDVLRVTKLPSFKGQYAPDGKTYWSVRQTRFGVKSNTPTSLGNLFTQFEFELFGVGVDAGQTTLRLRHAYGELGKFGAGQYWSPFMDIDVFPNTVEYWGPPGMAFFRNIQVRYMPIKKDNTKLTFALERPGASGDGGIYAGRIELQDVKPQFYLPDFSAEYRYGGNWGYVELAGIVRSMKWRDTRADTLSLDGSAVGWGGNLSSNIKAGKSTVIRLQALYGEGVENYMNDAPADVGVDTSFSGKTSHRPIKGVALPVLGLVGFVDHQWNSKFSSSVGYSMIDIDNSNGQTADAFKRGQYAIANFMYYPVNNVMTAVEYQWGEREDKSGFKSNDTRVQFSFKYNFSKMFTW